MRRYYIMDADAPGSSIVLIYSLACEGPEDGWMLGRRFRGRVTEPVEAVIKDDFDEGVLLPFYTTPQIMTRELCETIRDAGVDNLDVYDAIVSREDGTIVSRDYVAFNVLGVVRRPKSSGTSFDPSNPERIADTRIETLDYAQDGPGELLMFRLCECLGSVVVHQKVKEAIEARGIPNIVFLDALDYLNSNEEGTIDAAEAGREPAGEDPAGDVRRAFRAASPEELDQYLPVIDRLVEVADAKQRDALIGEFVYNAQNTLLKEGAYPKAKAILERYVALIPKIGQAETVISGAKTGQKTSLQERFAGDALALWSLSRDDSVWPLAMKLMPKEITNPSLAFNLACSSALRKDKPKMLEAIRLALDLGKRPEQFLTDSDFEAYRKDTDFLAVLKEYRDEKG